MKIFDINKFNMELSESIERLQKTCDEMNKDREIKLEDIPQEMERIMRNLEWNKMCENTRRIDLINEKVNQIEDKLDLIIRKLGGIR